MKKQMILVLMFTGFVILFIGAEQSDQNRLDREAIQNVIEEGYIEGLYKKVDLDLIEKYWHHSCDQLALYNDEIRKSNVGQLLESARAGGPVPPRQENAHSKIGFIDVSGDAAVVKVEVFFGEMHIFTDYISLYRFSKGWQIVTKIWYQHIGG